MVDFVEPFDKFRQSDKDRQLQEPILGSFTAFRMTTFWGGCMTTSWERTLDRKASVAFAG